MGDAADHRFFADLAAFDRFAEVPSLAHYRPAPPGWRIVITDVKGSTRAIEAGRYKDVNALGVASIVAVRNAIPEVEIPYVFGGDGATLLVPGDAFTMARVEPALRGLVAMSEESFGLEMRASSVPVSELVEAGHEVLVAKFGASAHVSFAMFAGSGLTEAERRIKDPEGGERYAVPAGGEARASFDGFECRWRPIPSRRGEVLALLVQAVASDRREASAVYGEVLSLVGTCTAEEGRPVAPEVLELRRFGDDFDQEARIKSGRSRGLRHFFAQLLARLSAWVGTRLMRRGRRAFGFPGDVYRREVTDNTDYRKFDDTLRMVIDVSADQRDALEAGLSALHEAGKIVYGIHAATSSLMTCAIGDYEGDHVHFVDGADGGYALAAKRLKAQLANLRGPGLRGTEAAGPGANP